MMGRLQHALGLAEQGFFVFPVVEGAKTPAVDDWPNRATRDAEQITKWWTSRDYNIGIATSSFGDDGALVVVDVDNKGGKNGDAALLELELQGFELPMSLEQSTPSGGRHIIYATERALKQGVDVLGPGLDIRSRGGFIVGPGSEIDGKLYQQINGHGALTAAPAWLVDRLGSAPVMEHSAPVLLPGVDAARALARGRTWLQSAAAPVGAQGNRNHTAFAIAAKLKDFGCDEDTARELMAAEWACEPPLDAAELEHVTQSAFRYGREPAGIAAPEAVFGKVEANDNDEDDEHPCAKFNAEYAFTAEGGGHVIWETTDAAGGYKLVHMDIPTFHAKHAAEKLQLGDKSHPITKVWISWEGRRSYDGFVFEPERQVDARWFNMWRGFAVQPAATAEHPMVERFLEHARDNICGGSPTLTKWLLGYFAHMVQKPWEKPLTALVFKGNKGTGKNALIERVGKLFGPHFLVTSKRRYLTSQFNGHFENNLCLVLDEAFWSGDKESEGILKDLITGNHHVIEHKNKTPYTIKNLTRVVIIGNEDWIVPTTADERRFAVFNVGDGRRQDRKYFHELRVGLDEEGGAAHLLRFLLDFDLSSVDVNAAPDTRGLLDQKLAGLDPLPKWWHECLVEGSIAGGDFNGDLPESVSTNRMREAFTRWAKQHNVFSRLPDAKVFRGKLRDMAPSVGYSRARVDGARDYIYTLPPLAELRAEWTKYIGHEENWEEA